MASFRSPCFGEINAQSPEDHVPDLAGIDALQGIAGRQRKLLLLDRGRDKVAAGSRRRGVQTVRSSVFPQGIGELAALVIGASGGKMGQGLDAVELRLVPRLAGPPRGGRSVQLATAAVASSASTVMARIVARENIGDRSGKMQRAGGTARRKGDGVGSPSCDIGWEGHRAYRGLRLPSPSVESPFSPRQAASRASRVSLSAGFLGGLACFSVFSTFSGFSRLRGTIVRLLGRRRFCGRFRRSCSPRRRSSCHRPVSPQPLALAASPSACPLLTSLLTSLLVASLSAASVAGNGFSLVRLACGFGRRRLGRGGNRPLLTRRSGRRRGAPSTTPAPPRLPRAAAGVAGIAWPPRRRLPR